MQIIEVAGEDNNTEHYKGRILIREMKKSRTN